MSKENPHVRYFPGELDAIETVKALGAAYGYGNLIGQLQQAWSDHLVAQGIDRQAADYGGRIICAWCDTDSRTGKKVKNPSRRKSRR
jgi:hypothetical protein